MPAKLKPSKEKSANQSKAMESGERRSNPGGGVTKPASLAFAAAPAKSGSDSEYSTPDEEYQTPSVENVTILDEKPKSVISSNQTPSQAQQTSRGGGGGVAASTAPPSGKSSRHFEAFYVNVDDPGYGGVIGGPTPSRSGSAAAPPPPSARSFVLHDAPHATRESAIAAGVPVIDGSERRSAQRGGGVAAPSNDAELRKIRADNAKERTDKSRPAASSQEAFYLNQRSDSGLDRPDSLNVHRTSGGGRGTAVGEGDTPSPVTSFAEIKKQRDNGEIPQSMFYLHGSPTQGPPPPLHGSPVGAPGGQGPLEPSKETQLRNRGMYRIHTCVSRTQA